MLGLVKNKPFHEDRPKARIQRPHFCRICGKQISGGHICQSCNTFIQKKKKEEQRKKKTQSKP